MVTCSNTNLWHPRPLLYMIGWRRWVWLRYLGVGVMGGSMPLLLLKVVQYLLLPNAGIQRQLCRVRVHNLKVKQNTHKILQRILQQGWIQVSLYFDTEDSLTYQQGYQFPWLEVNHNYSAILTMQYNNFVQPERL